MTLAMENKSNRRETCPSSLLTINPIFTALGSKIGIRGKRPATSHLRHDMAFKKTLKFINSARRLSLVLHPFAKKFAVDC
jgi:hypothetical protein